MEEFFAAFAKAVSLGDLLVVAAISTVIMGIIEAIIKPAFLKAGIDIWWLFYVSLVLGTPITWATGINAFPIFTGGYAWIGHLLTALLGGLGPKLIFDIIERGKTARLPVKQT